MYLLVIIILQFTLSNEINMFDIYVYLVNASIWGFYVIYRSSPRHTVNTAAYAFILHSKTQRTNPDS